jgi:hypothetical protein
MGLHISVDKEKTEMWSCLSSGCVRYEETSRDVYASIDDRRKDGLRIEKTVAVKKRGDYLKFIQSVFNDDLPMVSDVPKADEAELFETYKFVTERLSNNKNHYVGVKTEFTSPRGIRIHYRLRQERQQDGANIIVELTAEKDGERLVYRCFGYTINSRAIFEEAAKAIGTYILFADYVSQQAGEQTG